MLQGTGEDAEQTAAGDTLGFQDQALAMNWVQENSDNMDIAQTKIVLFGHNAGGWSVCNHVFGEQSAGLQSGAIMQSGYCEDIEGTQIRQQSDLLLQRLQHVCSGRGPAILKCLAAVNATYIVRYG